MTRQPTQAPTHTSDATIVRRIWIQMAAAVVGLLPFTAFSTFLVPIAAAVGQDGALVGGLRGLGGVAALGTGVAIAPVLARSAPSTVAGMSLLLLALASLMATTGTFTALVLFCLVVGIATAALTPVLLSSAAQSLPSPADGGRAATLVTATQTLAAVMAAPVLGGLALTGDWRTPLWLTVVLTTALGLLLLRRPVLAASPPETPAAEPGRSPGYWRTFGLISRRRDLQTALAISALRTCAFMGQLSFIAIVYHERFALDARTVTLVWTLSGASFFVGNYFSGRWARTAESSPGGTRVMLLCGVVGGMLALPLVTLGPTLAWALTGTGLVSVSHAVVAAAITTTIARRGAEVTTAAFSLNGAGQSVGIFAGAALGGLGLGVAGLPGLTLALSLPMIIALALVPSTGPPRDRPCSVGEARRP